MLTKTSSAVGALVAVAAVATLAVVGVQSRTTDPPSSPVTGWYRFDESRLPVAQRRTDPRIDPLPDRRLLTCDAGTPPDRPIVDYDRDPIPLVIDRRIVGYVQRADGRRQLTINGCPVYHQPADVTPVPSPPLFPLIREDLIPFN